jgi:hypothetical protein
MPARALRLALPLIAAAACDRRPLAAGAPGLGGSGGGGDGAAGQIEITFAPVNRDVDVLFMIDDSLGMGIEQRQLVGAFQSYLDALAPLAAPLPNLHLGIVSSSMGAGRETSIEVCPPGGDLGQLQTKPLGFTCTSGTLNEGEHFFANIDGVPNYTGTLANAFGCYARLGDGGCAFEHQFESVLRALGADGAPAPATNAGFLRPHALLQVVLFTDEDDCSAPPDSDLFDKSSMTPSDPLGPLSSYRCTEFGLLCGGDKPPRTPAGLMDLGACVSAEDGRLLRVADVVKALKSLKADPNDVYVAAIAGPKSPVEVDLVPSSVVGDTAMWPSLEPSCRAMLPDGMDIVADPAVRIAQWVTAFGDRGVFETICHDDGLGTALTAVGKQIGDALKPPCLPDGIDESTCKFVDHTLDSVGHVVATPLRACASSDDAGPCWFIDPGASLCAGAGRTVAFKRPGPPPTTALSTEATCTM